MQPRAPTPRVPIVAESDDDGKDDDQTVEFKAKGPGVSIGYKTDDFNIGLGISSGKAYDATKVRFNTKYKMWLPIPDRGGWIVSADMGVTYGDIGIDLKLVQGIEEEVDFDANVIPMTGDKVVAGKSTVGHGMTGFSAKISSAADLAPACH